MRFPAVLALLLLLPWCAPARTAQDDTYHHASGLFDFPTMLAGLDRVKVKTFDQAGNDVGVSYEDPDSRLLITVYAFPAPRHRDGTTSSLEQHFRVENASILGKWPNSSQAPWPSGLPVWSDEGVPGMLQAYSLEDGSIQSILQLYDYGDWRLKFRSTYPAAEAAHALQLIDAAHKAFAWPADPGAGQTRPAPTEP